MHKKIIALLCLTCAITSHSFAYDGNEIPETIWGPDLPKLWNDLFSSQIMRTFRKNLAWKNSDGDGPYCHTTIELWRKNKNSNTPLPLTITKKKQKTD